MTDELNKKSQTKWINEIWENGAPRTLAALTHECISAGVFNDRDRETGFFKWAKAFVHDAVRKEKDGEDLPKSGPTGAKDDDESVWAQRTFWDLEAYELNVSEHVKHGMGALRTAARLADECEERYGQRPEVPAI
jgi:hypothetical protein